jgi:iron complex outermembrane recepter protein
METKERISMKLSLPRLLLATACALPAQNALSAMALEEIVVTANKRSESLQDVPISITALTSDTIEQAGIDGVRDIGILTPGLQMAQNSTTWVPYIRGIGTQNTSAGAEAGVATYIDGVYMASPYGASITFNNIDRVEVLKGPQGTLFGRNASGGLVHIITKDPSQETQAYGKIGYGNYDTSIAQLYATTGISENLAADIALNYRNQDESWIDNVAPNGPEIDGDNSWGIRTKWLYEIDNLRVTAAADYDFHDSAQGDNRSIVPGSVGLGPLGFNFTSLPDFHDVQLNQPAISEVENYGGSLKVEYSLDIADFQSITAYRETILESFFDNDGTPIGFVDVKQNSEAKTFTQELQLTSNGSQNFDWIVGFFYMNDEQGYVQPQGLGLGGLAFPDPIDGVSPASVGIINGVETESFAVFAETTFSLTEATRLVTGVRYTRDEKEVGGITEVNLTDGSTLLTVPNITASESWGEPTWRIVLEHDLTEDMMVYASYNRGFRSGAYNTVAVDGIPLDPEIADAFELGFKSDLADGRVRLNGAFYYTDYQDLQIFLSLGTSTVLLNAASAEIMGAELEMTANITDELSLNLGVNWMETEYKDFAEGINGSIRNELGWTLPAPIDPEGNDLAYAPELTFNVSAKYEKALDMGIVGATVDYAWTDQFNWAFIGRLQQESYGVVNASLYWWNTAETYGVNLWARNLADEEYATYAVGQDFIGDHYAAAPPRTYGAEFKFRF